MRQNHLWNREDDAMFLRRIGAVREATVNMLANADFYGRRGVVVQKSAEGFKFANPGSMRVSLTEALQDSASDPHNGVMMKMLAMVEYGERAGSGLQGIFKTWQSVYHCEPKLEVTTSGGVDRTTLTLGFEGHQPDIEAMKLLYGNPYDLIDVSNTQESKGEMGGDLKNSPEGDERNDSVHQKFNKGSLEDTLISLLSSPEFTRNSSDQKVLMLLKSDPRLTLDRIAGFLNMTKREVQKITNRLQQTGVLSRKGSTKAGEWVVKDQLSRKYVLMTGWRYGWRKNRGGNEERGAALQLHPSEFMKNFLAS